MQPNRTTPGILAMQARVLLFRFTAEDLATLGPRHLAWGLLVTWIVGVGRYWDHPHPYLFQTVGLGSLAVMLALTVFFYLVLWPLKPQNWSFFNLLTFISLTALPATLYAIPVERMMALPDARLANVWFLGLVALWRVALLGRYIVKRTDLSGLLLGPTLLLPIALVIFILTLLNLEQVVFNIMAGMREQAPTANDAAYSILFLLSILSFFASPLLLFFYVGAVAFRWRRIIPREPDDAHGPTPAKELPQKDPPSTQAH